MVDHWNLIVNGIALAFTLKNILALILGTVIGIVVGVLPGIGPTAGMALLLPMTFGWPPATALILMGAIFFSSNFGGSITSILINAPGDASNSATMMDGFPMTENGRGNEALGISATSVIVGGGIGVILLVFTAPLIAIFALRFGPAENTLLAVFALSIIAAMVVGSPVKGLISAGIGLFLATIGYDGVSGNIRFSFGIPYFEDEIQLIPVVVGIFAVSQVITMGEEGGTIAKVGKLAGSLMEGMKSYVHTSCDCTAIPGDWDFRGSPPGSRKSHRFFYGVRGRGSFFQRPRELRQRKSGRSDCPGDGQQLLCHG